ncbi:MAG: DUF4864 domain-containing protein [Casimicrobiaceae bacterium]
MRTRRSATIAMMMLILWSWCWSPVARAADATLSKAEWLAVQQVIGQQLAALKTGRAEAAFGYAAPGIRQRFATPTAFLAMVATSYAELIAARHTEFLEGAVIEGQVIQPLRLIAPDNKVSVALYIMERQPDGGWRIAGCAIAPSRVQAV